MAWSFVGAGATTWTPAPSSPLTLPVPTGRQVGDLLVAVIFSTASFSVTTPTGWTLAAQYGTAGSTNGRCWVYYRVLTGAVGSTQAFTRSGTGSLVWTGLVLGYRSSTGMAASPLDVVTGNQITASNVTTGTAPGITTAAADGLLVAVSFQPPKLGPVSAIQAAKDPATPSAVIAVGAATPTSAPATGAWTARSAMNATLGTVCVADAVKGTAGATGAFQDTIGVAGHAGLMVVAFKPQPPTDALSVGNFDGGGAVLGAPSLGQVHALSASAFAASGAGLGAPILTPVVPLSADDFAAGAAAFGAPQLGQVHALSASAFAAGAAVLGQPDGLADYPDVEVHAGLSLGRAIAVAMTPCSVIGVSVEAGRALRATITLERGI